MRAAGRPPALGMEAIAGIRKLLQVDDAWSENLPNGFAWWAFQTRQELLTESLPGGDEARVLVRTPHLTAPTADAGTVRRHLARMNAETTGGAFRQEANGRIVHELSVWAGEDTAWVPQTVATCAMLALSAGGRVAAAHAEALGSSPIVSGHPVNGLRPWPDDMLGLDDRLLIPLGREPSTWSDPADIVPAIQIVNAGFGVALDTTGKNGLICEVGFGARDSSFLTVRATSDPPGRLAPGLPSNAPDPVFGNGLIAWIILPLSERLADADELAARLNDAEADLSFAGYGPMHLGGWTVWDPDGRPTPAYRLFLPNLLAIPMSAANVAMHLCIRAASASRLLLPDEEPLDGAGIAKLRMRQAPKVFDLPQPN